MVLSTSKSWQIQIVANRKAKKEKKEKEKETITLGKKTSLVGNVILIMVDYWKLTKRSKLIPNYNSPSA